jgi:hypothetical protein
MVEFQHRAFKMAFGARSCVSAETVRRPDGVGFQLRPAPISCAIFIFIVCLLDNTIDYAILITYSQNQQRKTDLPAHERARTELEEPDGVGAWTDGVDAVRTELDFNAKSTFSPNI